MGLSGREERLGKRGLFGTPGAQWGLLNVTELGGIASLCPPAPRVLGKPQACAGLRTLSPEQGRSSGLERAQEVRHLPYYSPGVRGQCLFFFFFHAR